MNQLRPLQPPLTIIEARLFTLAQSDIRDEVGASGQVQLYSTETATPPDWLQLQIRQRVLAMHAHTGQYRPGDLVRVSIPGWAERVAPVAILLDRLSADGYWGGWLTSPDVDYATHLDVVLEADASPVDPLGALIQVWNPVSISADWIEADIGHVTNATLAAIREMARAEGFGNAADPQPGRIAPVRWGACQLLTGTALGNHDDPRHAFQACYRKLAYTIARSLADQSKANVAPLSMIERTSAILERWLDVCHLDWNSQPLSLGTLGPSPDRLWKLDNTLEIHLLDAGDGFLRVIAHCNHPVPIELSAYDGTLMTQTLQLAEHDETGSLEIDTQGMAFLEISIGNRKFPRIPIL